MQKRWNTLIGLFLVFLVASCSSESGSSSTEYYQPETSSETVNQSVTPDQSTYNAPVTPDQSTYNAPVTPDRRNSYSQEARENIENDFNESYKRTLGRQIKFDCQRSDRIYDSKTNECL
ncbi:MAG: hypothetical protein HC836_30505 [Richelia sp. RM2_1_2]|nr:hypothetical protein [Richelia sp. RM2_1_2]